MLNISDLVILGKNLETNKGASVWPKNTLAVALIDSHGLYTFIFIKILTIII
jgi:hypothetical protein